jgi:hypothetical protein
MATNNNYTYAPAAVDTSTPPPTPIAPLDRTPAPVEPGPGLGITASTTPAVVPVQEVAVNPAGSTTVTNVKPTVPNYIEVMVDGNIIVKDATAINFTGSGVAVTANGAVATMTITSGGTYGNSNVTTLLASLGANTISGTGNITTTANISGGFILGNGSLLSGIAASYGNANVVANLAALGSNPISTTGNITGGNILGGANVNATTHTGTTVSVSANVTGGNITTAGLIVTTGNVSGGNVIAATLVQSATVSASGNVTGGNILTGGLISATGNITGGNILGGANVNATTHTGTTVSVSGNVTSGNVLTGGLISAAGNVTGNYFIGNGSQLTGISTSFAGEMHVSKDGNDSTGTGTILRPYLTITHALTQVAGGRDTIVIHPGEYTENPTITSTNTQLITYDATGASTIVVGTVTMANVTSRIAGLRMANLIIAGNSQAYISMSTVTGQFTKSSSGYVEVDDCELQVTGNVLISGSGSISIVGNKINNLVVNNAGAAVLVKGADDCVMPQVTAGSLNIVDSIIRASSNTANAVTASAGTVVTLMNNQIVTPAADNVARVSIAGYHSIISLVYDKANSTLSNSLNSVAYFQTANVDSLVSSGNVTGGNILTGGLISATGNITGGNVLGGANVNATTHTGTTVSVTANITGGNILTGGLISATGNITGGNLQGTIGDILNVNSTNLTVTNILAPNPGNAINIGAGGNNNLVVSNVLVQVQNVPLSVAGNVTGGNILTGGLISATGNVSGNFILGNGSQLTGIVASPSSNIVNGNSNVSVATSNGNVTVTSNGTNTWTFDTTGNLVIPGTSGGLIKTVANGAIAIAAMNNGTDNPAQLLSWRTTQPNPDTIVSAYANSATIMTDVNGTAKTWTFSNIGNLSAPGSVSATGNVTGGNLTTAGLTSTASLSVTGNTATITSANYQIGYLEIPQISLSANVTANLTVSGKHYYSVSASNLALTIADNSTVSWPVGTAISVINRGTANVTVAPAAGVSLYLAGNATSGNRTVTTYGMATVMNVAANIWMINGTVV